MFEHKNPIHLIALLASHGHSRRHVIAEPSRMTSEDRHDGTLTHHHSNLPLQTRPLPSALSLRSHDKHLHQTTSRASENHLPTMKLLPFISSALLATSVAARSTIHNRAVAPQDDELSVPGKNPLSHCENPKDDILALKSVDLDPNPPTA